MDRVSTLLCQVRGALRRIHEGGLGGCVECERAISPKRLLAVPWTPRCSECQEVAGRASRERNDSFTETLAAAAE